MTIHDSTETTADEDEVRVERVLLRIAYTGDTRRPSEWDWSHLLAGADLSDDATVLARYADAEPATWPTTDAERGAFADWQYEVANGDTLRGFRDWLAAQDSDGDPGTPGEVLFPVTRATVEERAGRQLSTDEADRFSNTFGLTTVLECIDGWLDGEGIQADDETEGDPA